MATWLCLPTGFASGAPVHGTVILRATEHPLAHSPFMTWVGWVRMLGVRSRSAIATATPAEEDTIADVTALQVTDSHNVPSHGDHTDLHDPEQCNCGPYTKKSFPKE